MTTNGRSLFHFRMVNDFRTVEEIEEKMMVELKSAAGP
jgi:hypothetical protein